MLRITVEEQDTKWLMRLEGKLSGEWVKEAASVWDSSPVKKAREIDLRELTSTDDAGKRLLCSMHYSGAKFTTAGVETNGLASDIRKGLLTMALIALTFVAAPAHAQEAPAPIRLTLKDAVTMALKQNPQVVIANLNLAESEENRTEARSALLPQIGFSASEKVQRGNVQALFGRRIPGLPQHNGPFWVTQAGPGISTPLFDLTLWHRWQAAKERVGSAAAQQSSARELNAQLVVSQYLGALRSAAEVDAAKSRLDLAKALFTLAGDLQKNGVGTGIDTLRANVQLQNETQRYTEAGTQLKVGLFGLNRLLNLDPQQTIELADSSSFFETPAFDANENIAQAYLTRPEMRTVAAEIRAAEQEKKAAKDQRLPRVSFNGGWTLQGVTPTSMIPVYQFGAAIDVPLFTGGRIEAQTAVADIEIRKLTQAQTEVRNQIALDVKTAVAQLESARTEVEAANLGVTLSRETVRQSQDRFRAGVANNIEVITAQDELARANDNQIKALYRYNQSRADLAHATGQMEAVYSN
jgi:outer membrane protein TolC